MTAYLPAARAYGGATLSSSSLPSFVYLPAARAYACAVLDGTIPACKWVRLAVERQQADLARTAEVTELIATAQAAVNAAAQGLWAGPLEEVAALQAQAEAAVAAWPWVFDADRAERPCYFIELLPHIKGEWAAQRALITLEGWQVFIVTTVFGWVHRDTGWRRFREVYLEVPRKNAKSTLSSGIALYMLAADGEHGAEIYSAATTREQARIVFDVAREMAARSPGLRDQLGVALLAHSITAAYTSSKFLPLAAEASTQDGLNVHLAVLDELHAHKRRELYDVLDTARGSRRQSLIWIITTAGTDRSGICYARRTHITKLLDRVIEDASVFGIIYTIDEGDDPHVEASWAKANPNWRVSVLPDDMAAASRKAEAMPSDLNNFLTKRLNVWVNGESAWMDMRAWERCAKPALQIEDFEGEKCWAGLDLAEKRDFAAYFRVIERAGVWHVFAKLYMNEVAVQESGNAHLAGWARSGYVTMTDGNITDFDVIADDMRADCKRFDMQEIAFDPHMGQYFAVRLLEEGLPMVEIAQRSAFYSSALIQVDNLVHERKLIHEGNPVMAWMMSNLVVKVSKFNELRSPTKERAENKIDGPMAMLMALGRALANAPKDNIDDFLNNPISA